MTASNNNFKQIVETIKSHIDCRDLFRRFWPARFIESGSHSLCPFHDDHDPSLKLDREGAHCFGACGKGFDAIDIYAAAVKCNKGDAIKALAAELGIETGGPTPAKDSNGTQDFAARFEYLLKAGIPAEARDYLRQRRGLSERIVKKLQDRKLIAWSAKKKALVFPLVSPDRKRIVGLQYTPIDGSKKTFAKGTDGKAACFFFNAHDEVDGKRCFGEFFVLTEAIIDAFSVWNAFPDRADEYADVCSIMSASDPGKIVNLGDTPILFLDRDEAGQKATLKAIAELGERVRVVSWRQAPEGMKDANDLLRAGHSDVIVRMVRGSMIPTSEQVEAARQAVNDLTGRDGKARKTTDEGQKSGLSLFWKDEDGRKHLFKHKKAAAILEPLIKDMLYDRIARQWMRYRTNFWQAITDLEAAQIVDRLITTIEPDADYNITYRKGVMDQLSLYLCWDDHQSPGNTIPFRNGVLFLDDMAFKPHAKEHFFTWQLPFDYSPVATCDPVKNWLNETVKDSMLVELLRAYLNAILTGRADLHRYLELIGPGGSGKGTFIRLAEAIIGGSNVHVTELKRLENNNFETAKLYGKRLCTITDAEKYSGDVTTLKAITGGDSVPFEEKHKQSGQHFRYGGMVLIAANQEVASSDYTSGLQRRRITVRFENAVPSEKRRDLEGEFQPFLPGVIVWVLGMPGKRVTELLRDTEKHVKTLAGVGMQTLMNTNPIAAWAHEDLVYSSCSKTNVGRLAVDAKSKEILNAGEKLYPNYCKWATETGRKQLASNTFVTNLRDLLCFQLKLAGVKHKRDNKGGHFTRIGIRKPNTDEGLSPLEEYFGQGADEGEVTGGDAEVTHPMTDQTRIVTKVTHLHDYLAIENPCIENPCAQKGEKGAHKKNIEVNSNPQKCVTSVTEPKSPSPGVSPSVTGVTQTSDKNLGRNEGIGIDEYDEVIIR